MSLHPFYQIEEAINQIQNMFEATNFFGYPGYNPHRNPFTQLRQAISPFMQPQHQPLAIQDLQSKITADDKKFQVNIDVQHFAPNEISVKVVNGFVVIEGKHEEKSDQHGYVSRQFVRRFLLPQGCLPDTVQSELSSDGILSVTAPKVLPLPSIGEKIVPITYAK